MYLSPIQYFITFGVNRLNGDDGRCVLTIRQSTYSKRPALLSDIKYRFGKIDLNSGRIKRALRENQSSRKCKKSPAEIKKRRTKLGKVGDTCVCVPGAKKIGIKG